MNQMPESAKEATLASLKDSTIKQYNTGLKKWWNFTIKNKFDPFKAVIPNIISFLAYEQKKGAAFGTLNSYRSAIALIVGPDISEDHRVKRFMKGAFNLKPNKPKYDITWDPQIVLNLYCNKEVNEKLSLKELTRKLITLLAIITTHRMQTYSLIKIENIKILEEKILIKIPECIKTSGINKLQPILVIPFYKKDCNVCAANTLVYYLSRTKELRGTENSLFISFQKPYKKVTSQTLSRWVIETLAEAGLDTNIFTAHSTRHAATSTAKDKGVSIDVIKKTAGWTTSSSTFAKFYDRTIVNNKETFARAIYED